MLVKVSDSTDVEEPVIASSLKEKEAVIENEKVDMKFYTSASAYNSEDEVSSHELSTVTNNSENFQNYAHKKDNSNMRQLFSALSNHNGILKEIIETEKKLKESINEEALTRMMLERRYPVKFAIAHSIIFIFGCALAFIVQILMIVYQSPYYFLVPGIWVPIYKLVSIILHLVLSELKHHFLQILFLLISLF